jgi:hypothetical protein
MSALSLLLLLLLLLPQLLKYLLLLLLLLLLLPLPLLLDGAIGEAVAEEQEEEEEEEMVGEGNTVAGLVVGRREEPVLALSIAIADASMGAAVDTAVGDGRPVVSVDAGFGLGCLSSGHAATLDLITIQSPSIASSSLRLRDDATSRLRNFTNAVRIFPDGNSGHSALCMASGYPARTFLLPSNSLFFFLPTGALLEANAWICTSSSRMSSSTTLGIVPFLTTTPHCVYCSWNCWSSSKASGEGCHCAFTLVLTFLTGTRLPPSTTGAAT